ncbi:hypothetical protein BBJ28_00014508, partial [Nothophytophthora sp. Chile5]
MFCGECGHRWEPDEIASARFCAECGAPREDVPPAAAPTPAIPAATSSFSAPPASVPAASTPYGGASSSSLYSSYAAPASTAASTSSYPSYSAPSTAAPTSTGPSYSASSSYSSYSTPTPAVAPPTAAPTASLSCSKCFTPFGDSTAAFCGECGASRPAATVPPSSNPPAAADDDGDLFGLSSTSYSTPQFTATPQPTPSYNPSGSTFASSVSVSYTPPHAAAPAPAASTPAAYDPYTPPQSVPPTPAPPAEPPASVGLDAGASSGTSISTLLANLSVSSKPEGERDEPDGNGAGVAIRQVTRTRNMDSLTTRMAISEAVERNRTSPMERSEGYNVTKVNETITVVQNERADPEEERYYNQRTLPDNGEWLQVLRKNRQDGSKFTDPQFPPDTSSIFRDASNPTYPHLQEYIWKWKRVTDFFNETAYVEITMLDDDKKLVCSMSIKSPAEAESILEVIRLNPTPIDAQFLQIAKDTVTSGVQKRKRDHLMLLTKNMIVHMSDFVQDGLQRFELMWEKSLLDHYKPLAFSGVGDGSGYRVDGSEAGVVSRVSVLVPVNFQAQGTCLFDRSR